MSTHAAFADYASHELARILRESPSQLIDGLPPESKVDASACGIGRDIWPHPDGLIMWSHAQNEYSLAMEMKTVAESLHGTLTALGQGMAYLDRDFNSSAIVIPERYSSHDSPGEYLSRVLRRVSPQSGIAVVTYEHPDLGRLEPFRGRLKVHRKITADPLSRQTTQTGGKPSIKGVETIWAHFREGSCDPSVISSYLKAVSICSLSPDSHNLDGIKQRIGPLPAQLERAAQTLSQRGKARVTDPLLYLSNSTGTSLHDKAWVLFWMTSVLHANNRSIWVEGKTPYEPLEVPSELTNWEGEPKYFFAKRSDSRRTKLCIAVNKGEMSEDEAWEDYAENIRNRAHSLREDVDSFLSHIGYVDPNGVTALGNSFLDAVRSSGSPNSEKSKDVLLHSVLTEGGYEALLHYIFRLTEDAYSSDPLMHENPSKRGEFLKDQYLDWLDQELIKHRIRKTNLAHRSTGERRPLQGELVLLRKLGVIREFRVGVGLVIDWSKINAIINSSSN